MAGKRSANKKGQKGPISNKIREALLEIRSLRGVTSETILNSVGEPAGFFALHYVLGSKRRGGRARNGGAGGAGAGRSRGGQTVDIRV